MKPFNAASMIHLSKLVEAYKKSFQARFDQVTFADRTLHFDIAGLLPASVDGVQYFYISLDQCSRFTHAALFSARKGVGSTFETYIFHS